MAIEIRPARRSSSSRWRLAYSCWSSAGSFQFALILWSQNTINQVARDTARWAVTRSAVPCDSAASRAEIAATANELAEQWSLIAHPTWGSAPAIAAVGSTGVGVDWRIIDPAPGVLTDPAAERLSGFGQSVGLVRDHQDQPQRPDDLGRTRASSLRAAEDRDSVSPPSPSFAWSQRGRDDDPAQEEPSRCTLRSDPALTALMMVILIGLTALAIDVSSAYLTERRWRSIADAAVARRRSEPAETRDAVSARRPGAHTGARKRHARPHQ